MKTTRFLTKSLSIFLAALMTILLVPLSVYAEIFDFPESAVSDDAYYWESYVKPEVYELVDRREKNVKHFKLSDGTVTAVMYETPVHYIDNDGKWQDIDNTLTDNGSEYSNTNSRVKFAKITKGNGVLFTLHENNTKISISLNDANKKVSGQVTNTVTEHVENTPELQKQMTLDKLSSRILYPDILDGVDLEYIIKSGNIKENIIVKEILGSYSYSFTVSLNNLVAKLNADGSVCIKNDLDETVYIIPSGYMYDASGEYSEAVTYELTDLGNDKYTLTVTADEAWINSAERAFPVTIDPPIVSNRSAVTDLYISSSSPSTSYANETYLYVGPVYRTYVKLNSLPTLPSNAYLTSASVSLKCLSGDGYPVGVYQVLSDWSSTLTWNGLSSAGEKSSAALDYVNLDLSNGRGYRYSWDITTLAHEWYNGLSPNYGVCFAVVDGATASTSTSFYSAENTSSGYAPCFTVNYRDMKGLEAYWTSLSHSAGLAGTGSVNVANGNLTFLQSTVTSSDSIFGYTPTFVYNSSLAGKAYTTSNAQIPQTTSYMPNGFKMSINETLLKKSYTSDEGITENYYVWADSDGTEHSFFSANGSATEYEDEDGLKLKLNTSTTSALKITDSNHNIREFSQISSSTSGWYLTKITDKNGNSLVFTFDTNNRPVSVGIKPVGYSVIEQLRIVYNSSGAPIVIYRPWGGDAMLFRYSATATGTVSTAAKAYLREAVYVTNNGTALTDAQWTDYYNGTTTNTNIKNNATVYYTYDSAGRLASAKDGESGYEVRYTYVSGKVSAVQEFGANGSAGQKIGFVYYSGYTMVRASGKDDVYGNTDDVVTNHMFDREGRVISSYSSNIGRTDIYGVANGEYVSNNEKAKNSLKVAAHSNGSNSANYLLNGGFESGLTYWSGLTGGVTVSQAIADADTLNDHEASFAIASGRTWSISQNVFLRPGSYSLSLDISSGLPKNTAVIIKAISKNSSSTLFIETVKNTKEVGRYYAFLDFNAVDRGSGGEVFEIQILVNGISGASACTVTIDDIMLSKSTGAQSYNMVNAGSFEGSAVDATGAEIYTPSDFWTMSEDSASSAINIIGFVPPFERSLVLNGSVSDTMVAEQVIYSAEENYSYRSGYPRVLNVSGFGRATQILSGTKGKFALKLVVTYLVGTEEITDERYFNFSKQTDAWQYVSGSYVIPDHTYVKEIKICCEYTNTMGNAYFDDISVIYDPDGNAEQYYYYEDTGELGLHVIGNKGTYYEYDSIGNITEIIDSYGTTQYEYVHNPFTFVYNQRTSEIYYTHSGNFPFYYLLENGKLTESETLPSTVTNALGTMTERMRIQYGYNDDGQLTYTSHSGSIANSSSSSSINTNKTYSTDPHYYGALLTESENNSSPTRYLYEDRNGRLEAVINPDESSGTFYVYDQFGRLEKVLPATYLGGTASGQTDAESVEYTYSGGLLTAIDTDSTKYTLTHDEFGNTQVIKAGSYSLATYTYNENNGKLNSITYGNGFTESYTYDPLDRIETVLYNDTVVQKYTYDSAGNISKLEDVANGKTYIYKYDVKNQLEEVCEETPAGDTLSSIHIFYDQKSRPEILYYCMGYTVGSANKLLEINCENSYNTDGNLENYVIRSGNTVYTFVPSYDGVNRVTERESSLSVSSGTLSNTVVYEYDLYGGIPALQVSKFTSTIRSTPANTTSKEIDSHIYLYSYDDNNNLTGIYDDMPDIQYQYTYDDLGQLIREDNLPLNKSFTYTYDNAGNILSRKEYAFTTGTLGTATNTETYGYNNPTWGDLLTSINGNSITYDAIGNPLTYYVGGLSSTLTWVNGRRLASFSNSNNTITYTYNDEGIRLSKTVNGVTHTYQLNGSQIVSETWGVHTIFYIYAENGTIAGMRYRTSSYAEGVFDEYLFEKNLQGDVVAIYSASGTKLVSYLYDAWGEVTTTYHNGGINTSAKYNPFRYRGYYYDEEIGLYYLNSRYYDPSVGRFISADRYVSTGQGIIGNNMFAYCNNNPIMYVDSTGDFPWLILAAVLLFTPIGGTALQVVTSVVSYAGIAVASAFDEDIRNDMDAIEWNPFNTDEAATLNSSKVSFYKGVPVFKTNTERSGSFGAIFLTNQSVADDLKHERGHNYQLMMMGIGTYGFTVGIPSPLKLGPWAKNKNYYGAPWETMADILGKVEGRPHSKNETANAWGYYAVSAICFPLTALYWIS